MDVVINSQIQSPLVRTLARTKGKSQSFTHSIADNVPPCSFSKIQIGAQNATEKQYGRTYKLKIPQYGYLRDVILKYTTKENVVSEKIVGIIDPLYQFNYIGLDDIRAAGTHNLASAPATGGGAAFGGATYPQTPSKSVDFSWYNLQNAVLGVANASGNATDALNGLFTTNFGVSTALEVRNVLAPQFAKLIPCATGAGVFTNTNGYSTAIPKSKAGLTSVNILSSLVSQGAMCRNEATYSSSMSQLMKINGDPKLWSEFLRFYMNVYANYKDGDAISTMVWEQLRAEPVQTVAQRLYTTLNQTAATQLAIDTDTGVQLSTTGYTLGANEVAVDVDCTLPRFVVARRKGGEIIWVPKLPQLRYDGNGTVVGVDFIPLDFIHPNDDDDTFSKLKQVNLSHTEPKYNFRTFAFGDDNTVDEDWNMWDWQTEAFYYQGIAANVAERIQLSTHNRPIQTVFPQEIYSRIQKLEPAERQRYLKMMKPRVSKSGHLADSAGATGYPGEKSMYFPLFLSSTENPSLNFDTRFVEQLDIDVVTRPITDVFAASDVIQQASDPSTLYSWVDLFRTTVFGGDYGDPADWAASAETFVPTSTTLLTNLALPKMITKEPASWEAYNALTPRSYVIDLRSFTTVPANEIQVEALLYFHNFHDTTAQAIRDSNFKPGTPASLLMYNTYLETPQMIKKEVLQNTQKINTLLSTNNLVFGTTFFVRRRSGVPKKSNKRDHNMQTLPIKSVVLTASGQQIYSSVLDESQITDPFDYDLASGKIGRKYNNSLISQAIEDPYTGESFFMYTIPYGFSSDMTYNSGSIAFQTLNNPVLTVEVDVGSEASQPIDVVVQDNEFELVVFHNYWQMIRIDSNTGAITRSLDL
jgi:hypothetical protein